MQIILNGIIAGGVYALIALGFNLIFASVRFFHLLYGILAVSGVYFTLELQGVGLPFGWAALMAAVLAGLLGMAFWQFLYRPIKAKGASSLVLMVVSFGALIVVQNLIALLWKNNTYSLSLTQTIKPAYDVFGLSITLNQLAILGISALAMGLLELFLQGTRWGLAIRAIGDNPELTTILGLKTNRVILLVFFVGSFMGALGADLAALEIGVRPTYGLMLVLKAVIASIIGGIGSMRGALIGGLILGITENLGIYYWGGGWQEVTAYLLLTLFLLFRPQGLFTRYASAA